LLTHKWSVRIHDHRTGRVTSQGNTNRQMIKYSSKEIIRAKDEILNFVYEKGPDVYTGNLANHLKIEINLVSLLTEELSDNKFLNSYEVSNKDAGRYKEFASKITPKGVVYLMGGGASGEYEINNSKKIWSVVVTIASIINAISIIAISYLTYKATDTTNQLNLDLKKKEQTIDSLSKLINNNDSLKIFKKSQPKNK
jgi:hypothetical protein